MSRMRKEQKFRRMFINKMDDWLNIERGFRIIVTHLCEVSHQI